MTEFTKEELQRIIEGVSWWLDGDDSLYSQKLIDKIQSMIDNYSEDKYNPDCYCGSIARDGNIITKCGYCP